MAPAEPTTEAEKPYGEPEGESEPNTIMPEIMTNQEAFLMYGIFIFALAVFCIVLLVLYIIMKRHDIAHDIEGDYDAFPGRKAKNPSESM